MWWSGSMTMNSIQNQKTMDLKEFNDKYFPGENAVEVTDKKEALNYLQSRTISCWGNGPVKGTGWTMLAHPSIRSKGDKRLVLVCRTNLIHTA